MYIKIEDIRVHKGIYDETDHHFFIAKLFFLVQYNNQKVSINTQNQTQNLTQENYNLESLQHKRNKYLFQSRLESSYNRWAIP